MKTDMITVDGNRVNTRRPVQIDNHVTTFTVSIRSMSAIGEDTVKDLIEKKLEVVSIEKITHTMVVR